MATQVMIVDNEGLFRDMLRSSLSQQPGLEVIGCTGDAASAIRMAHERKPQVALMDIDLGEAINGIEAGLKIKEDNPQIGIVLLSSHQDKEYISAIPLDQVSGWSYMTKQSVSDLSTLTRAIEGAAVGLNIIDPVLIRALKPKPATMLNALSPRLLEILALMAEGYSNQGIAQKLTLGEKSVENYINTLYQQLQIGREEPIHPRVKATRIYLKETQAA